MSIKQQSKMYVCCQQKQRNRRGYVTLGGNYRGLAFPTRTGTSLLVSGELRDACSLYRTVREHRYKKKKK